MAERIVKIRGYTVRAEVEGADGKTRTKTRMASRGEVVSVSEEEAAEGDALGYFVPPAAESDEAPATEAEVVEMSDDELDEWIAGNATDSKPSIGDIVAAATDAESAERLLAAENRVAAVEDREPRVGLEKKLAAIIGAEG